MKPICSGTLPRTSGITTATRSTCSTQKERWSFIVLTVIEFLLLIQLSSALEVSLSFPSTIQIDKEFTATISADTTDTYDVKIFIHESEDEEIKRAEYISEIYSDGKWVDPWFYLSGVFPEQSEYRIRAITSPGARQICVRLRKSNKDSSFEQQCYPIEVKPSDSTSHKNDDDIEEDKSPKETPEYSPALIIDSPEINTLALPVQEEPILLNSPKSEKGPEITTRSNTKRNAIILSFTGFCVVLLILLALKKL